MYFIFVFAVLFALTLACGPSHDVAGSSGESSEDSSEDSSDNSSEDSTENPSDDSSQNPSEDASDEASQESSNTSLFDGIYSIREIEGSDIVVPLTNGRAVARVSDGVVGLYADSGDNYLARLTEAGELTTELIATGVSPGTVAAVQDAVLAVYQLDTGSERLMKATWSTDGGETGIPLTLGDKGVGAAVPSACLWQEGSDVKGLVAWVAPPTEEDRGPLYFVEMTNGVIGAVQQISTETAYSAPSLSCSSDGQYMVVRYQPDSDTEITIHFGKRTNGTFSLKEVFKGADPSLCVAGSHAWIGSHRGAQVNLAHSTDGGTSWETIELDASARFASVGCFEEKVIVLYGNWPDTSTAMKHDAATRQCTGQFSDDGGRTFVTHQPVGTDGYQGPSTVIMDSNGIVLVLKDTNRQVVRIVVD